LGKEGVCYIGLTLFENNFCAMKLNTSSSAKTSLRFTEQIIK
jgi:hypothetical protein